MRKLFKVFTISGGLLLGASACMEVHPLLTPQGPPISSKTCQALPIEKNIIGTWRFESFNPENKIKTGTITFDAQKKITDPDSLFGNRVAIGGLVIAKTYDPKVISPLPLDSRLLFVAYQVTKGGTVSTYYEVVSNECNKIRMVFGSSKIIGFELTR